MSHSVPCAYGWRRKQGNGRSSPAGPNANWSKRRDPPLLRQLNQTSRAREYLTADEVERMILAARQVGGRVASLDALLIVMAYRHSLRASELTALRWDQVDLKAGTLQVARLKHGSPSTHPLRGPELRALRAWKRAQGGAMPYIFSSLRGALMTRRTVHHVVAEAGKAAGIDFPVHPHMRRHATGYYLADAGQDTRAIQLYLRHRNIQHSVKYTELAADRFKDFWRDDYPCSNVIVETQTSALQGRSGCRLLPSRPSESRQRRENMSVIRPLLLQLATAL
jgi:type 1 fimbriae regulatory protein FimE